MREPFYARVFNFRNINTSVFSGPGVPAVLGVRGNRNPRRFLAFCRPKCPVGDKIKFSAHNKKDALQGAFT